MTRSDVEEMAYEASLSGSLSLSFAGRVPVKVVTVTGGAEDVREFRFLSVGAAEPVQAEEGGHFRVAFDLLNYQGDGRYTIGPGSPADLSAASPDVAAEAHSNVLVQHWSGELNQQPVQFQRALEACVVETTAGGVRGTLTCPQVGDEGEGLVEVRMSWGAREPG